MPTLRERLALAIRQNPVRGLGVALLFLLALAFLVATVVAFRTVEWVIILGAGGVLLAVVLGAVGAATLLMRRG